MPSQQETYIYAFSRLSTDKSPARWDEKTRHRAPHKPILLLAILDLFAEEAITTNLIELTPELGELFAIYWSKVQPMSRPYGNIAMPFWHLQSDKFWHLLPRPSYELLIQAAPRIHAVAKLNEITFGAKLDEELFKLLCVAESRELLRLTLIQTYFTPTLHEGLFAQGQINVQAFEYSERLLEQAKANQPSQVLEGAGRLARDQGFRRAIVRAYEHRCGMCGLRVVTADGHTAVAAAHIIPWSISHNDDPRNGLALCHLCHWTFDEGLVTLTDHYHVKTSPQLSYAPNIPQHLHTVVDKKLLGPRDETLWPFLESIRWHRKEIYRRR